MMIHRGNIRPDELHMGILWIGTKDVFTLLSLFTYTFKKNVAYVVIGYTFLLGYKIAHLIDE